MSAVHLVEQKAILHLGTSITGKNTPVFTLNNNDFQPVLTLYADGLLEIGDGYKPTESAAAFLIALQLLWAGFAGRDSYENLGDRIGAVVNHAIASARADEPILFDGL